MQRFLIAALAALAIACGGSTEPAAADVTIELSAPARTTSFVVRNHTTAAVILRSCGTQVAVAVPSPNPTGHVSVCVEGGSTVTIAAGGSLPGTISLPNAGTFELVVTLSDSTTRTTGPFTVP